MADVTRIYYDYCENIICLQKLQEYNWWKQKIKNVKKSWQKVCGKNSYFFDKWVERD